MANSGVLPNNADPQLPTFMDHFRELQGRLFAIVVSFVVFSAAAYPFFDQITKILVAPLPEDQELIYLTPGGAISFIIKVCLYVGTIFSLPVIIYNIYRFVMPAIQPVKLKTVLKYTIASFVLAILGMVFAYFVSLPASIYFLTNFNLSNIEAMLTVDSYFSFVMTYLLAGAMLFQLPLVMLIINSAHKLNVKKLMGYQRHMIVGSFVVAAVISPTPDALNQTLLAAPVVVMYQLGIILLWLKNRKQKFKRQTLRPLSVHEPVIEQKREASTELDDALKHLKSSPSSALPPTSATQPRPVSEMTKSPTAKPSLHTVILPVIPKTAAVKPKHMDMINRSAKSSITPVETTVAVSKPPQPAIRPKRPVHDIVPTRRRTISQASLPVRQGMSPFRVPTRTYPSSVDVLSR